MNKYLKLAILVILFVPIFLIRAYAADLFYDPLIEYFKNDYLYSKLPTINILQLAIDMLFRYVLHAILTITIIWLLFRRKEYVKFTSYFLILAFILLMTVFIILIKNNFENGYLLPFYIRRFLIHPLFLFILLPAFYFQKLSNR